MAFQMMYRHHRFAQRKRQRVGIAGTGQQRTAQAGALGEGDGIDVAVADTGFFQTGLGKRHQAADVVATGQLRHHAAVFGVHGHLGVQLVADQAACGVVQRDTGFVAGRFDAEN